MKHVTHCSRLTSTPYGVTCPKGIGLDLEAVEHNGRRACNLLEGLTSYETSYA